MKNYNELTLNQNLGDTKLVQAWSVMLEPLAASVISTVLSARQFAIPSSAQSAFKAMGRPSGSTFPPNFFNPHPRRSTKGKERAHADVACGLCTKDGMSSGCVGNTATTSASGTSFSYIPN